MTLQPDAGTSRHDTTPAVRYEACRHCYRDIRPAVIGPAGDIDLWEDSNGITVCKKRADGEQFLFHQPMGRTT